jgi:glutathione S-transferase
MKLYYAPGACSLSQHINLREAGLEFDLVKVDLRAKRTEDDRDFLQINPKGQVPTLERDDGQILTENPVIAEYIADLAQQSGLIPPAGTIERYRVMEWLSFVGSELHKTFGPLFRPNTPDDYKAIATENFGKKLDVVEQHLAKGHDYLAGDRFSAADAYCYVVLRWPSRVGMDLSRWPTIGAYSARIAARPAVQEALKAEGLS